jgi:two-component system chemotaxis sensor kinase CheA
MDAVKATVESLGGHVELRSQPGRGTVTTLVVPITAAVQRVLLVGFGEDLVAIPIAKVERVVELPVADVERAGAECFALVDGEPLLVIDLAARLGLSPPPPSPNVPLVLADLRGQRVGVRIERLASQQEIYVKPVPELLTSVRALAGMTVLGDGRPVFVLDLNQLA